MNSLFSQDGIPGVMKWRQFPSPFLASTEGQKTLTSIWRPCLSDPFPSELLPHLPHPEQLQGPHPDDLVDEWYIYTCIILYYHYYIVIVHILYTTL